MAKSKKPPVNNEPGEINFASELKGSATNESSSINFAQELEDQESKCPSGGAPDPNDYRNHDADDGFVKNVAAGGGHPDDGAFTPSFVNGVDHEEAPDEEASVEDQESEQRRG